MSDDEYLTEADIDLETPEGLDKIKRKVKEIASTEETQVEGIIDYVFEEDESILEFIIKIDNKNEKQSGADMLKIVDCTGFKKILIGVGSEIPKSIYDKRLYNKLKKIITKATKKDKFIITHINKIVFDIKSRAPST